MEFLKIIREVFDIGDFIIIVNFFIIVLSQHLYYMISFDSKMKEMKEDFDSRLRQAPMLGMGEG